MHGVVGGGLWTSWRGMTLESITKVSDNAGLDTTAAALRQTSLLPF